MWHKLHKPGSLQSTLIGCSVCRLHTSTQLPTKVGTQPSVFLLYARKLRVCALVMAAMTITICSCDKRLTKGVRAGKKSDSVTKTQHSRSTIQFVRFAHRPAWCNLVAILERHTMSHLPGLQRICIVHVPSSGKLAQMHACDDDCLRVSPYRAIVEVCTRTFLKSSRQTWFCCNMVPEH
jgi:hypothetical protein